MRIASVEVSKLEILWTYIHDFGKVYIGTICGV